MNILHHAYENNYLTLIESVNEFVGNVIQLMRDDYAYVNEMIEPLFRRIGKENCFVKHYDKEENKVQLMSDQINYEELK